MERVRREAEILQWFKSTLKDDSIARFDDLKTGAHLVQLLHLMDPTAFDLSRCDFIPLTLYHYEKNFKLFQEVLSVVGLDTWVNFVVERVMEGSKQRDLFHLCSYFKLHFESLKQKVAARSTSPQKRRHQGDESAASANKSSLMLSAKQLRNDTQDIGAENGKHVCAVFVGTCEEIAALQEQYDPAMERQRAKEKRWMRSHAVKNQAMAWETASLRSGSDATSLGTHSAFTHNPSLLRRRVFKRNDDASKMVRTSSDGISGGLIQSWFLEVQTTPSNADGTSPRSSDAQTPATNSARGANSEPCVGLEAAPLSNRSHVSQDLSVPPPFSQCSMGLHPFASLKHFRLWDLPTSVPAFLKGLADMHLSDIVEVDDESIAHSDFVPFDELIRRKDERRGQRKPRVGGSPLAKEKQAEMPTPAVEDPWDEFDALVAEAS